MRATEAFIVGAIMGAVVAWVWGRRIEAYVGEQTRGVRRPRRTGCARSTRRQESCWIAAAIPCGAPKAFLQDTKEHVSDALRVGQDVIRPAAASANRGEPTA